MEKLTFELCLFNSPQDFDRSIKSLLMLMESLVRVNLLWLLGHPNTPSIYAPPTIYKLESGERWLDIPNILQKGSADCEDLSCARVAEYRFIGVNASPVLKKTAQRVGGSNLYHALVKLPDGRLEDPSRALGMSGHAIVRKPVFVES